MMKELSAFLVIGGLLISIALYCFPSRPKPKVIKPIPIKINTTKVGESIGKGVGRLGRGFVKGVLNSNDNK